VPRHPQTAARVAPLGGSVFEKFRARLARRPEPPVKLHIGDTYRVPPYPLPLAPEFLERFPHTFQYCNTFGIKPLREVLRDKLEEDNSLVGGVDDLMVTSGASNALAVSTQALLDPGDEVLLPTPAWPFFAGMVRVAGATPVQAPFYTRLASEPDLDIGALLESAVTPRTAALYLNTPNNPSGKVLSRDQLQTVADVCRRHDLWVLSDEAYDGLTYDGHEHVSIGSLPGMRERTLSIFTCSKAFMFAGLRLGWISAPAEVIGVLNKTMVHQLYGPNTVGQEMMIEPIRTRAKWLPAVRDHYQELRDRFLAALDLDLPAPEGTYFVLFDTTSHLRGRDFDTLVGECLDSGVTVAPGGDFGPGFERHLRLCFTADTPDRTLEGARRLRGILRG